VIDSRDQKPAEPCRQDVNRTASGPPLRPIAPVRERIGFALQLLYDDSEHAPDAALEREFEELKAMRARIRAAAGLRPLPPVPPRPKPRTNDNG
jgi:hypothetical protein